MLSIVIPTFRREAYLPPLFASLAAQIASCGVDAEVIVVDNSPDASARVVAARGTDRLDALRYVHEPRPGVAQARNRGVAEAAGSHVVFLDDDEVPGHGWLATYARMAATGAAACFGAIDAQFDSPPPAALRQPLERVFSRHLAAPPSADVTGLRAYLGSGNSMFRRDVLAQISPPFDTAFNGGGEDVWLLRKLVDDRGVVLIWCPQALVAERVPADRATMAFLRRRRFSDRSEERRVGKEC